MGGGARAPVPEQHWEQRAVLGVRSLFFFSRVCQLPHGDGALFWGIGKAHSISGDWADCYQRLHGHGVWRFDLFLQAIPLPFFLVYQIFFLWWLKIFPHFFFYTSASYHVLSAGLLIPGSRGGETLEAVAPTCQQATLGFLLFCLRIMSEWVCNDGFWIPYLFFF